jgi:N-acyl-D-aspartate/D-glutamate deacylase
LPADTFGLKDRGRIRVGAYADIVAFDANRFLPRATYVEPQLLSEGVVHLVVNGRPEIADGKLTGVLAGRGLRKTPTAGTCP